MYACIVYTFAYGIGLLIKVYLGSRVFKNLLQMNSSKIRRHFLETLVRIYTLVIHGINKLQETIKVLKGVQS